MKKIVFFAILFFLFLAGCTNTRTYPTNSSNDEVHSCITAGFAWCEAKQKCVKTSEDKCGSGAASNADVPTPVEKKPATGTGIANPASAYCLQHGGISNIVTDPDGSQRGECVLPGGRTCEEWLYMRGECK
jgi:putative hemolysin